MDCDLHCTPTSVYTTTSPCTQSLVVGAIVDQRTIRLRATGYTMKRRVIISMMLSSRSENYLLSIRMLMLAVAGSVMYPRTPPTGIET